MPYCGVPCVIPRPPVGDTTTSRVRYHDRPWVKPRPQARYPQPGLVLCLPRTFRALQTHGAARHVVVSPTLDRQQLGSLTSAESDQINLAVVGDVVPGQPVAPGDLAYHAPEFSERAVTACLLVERIEMDPEGVLLSDVLPGDPVKGALKTTFDLEVSRINGEHPALLHDTLVDPARELELHHGLLAFDLDVAPLVDPRE